MKQEALTSKAKKVLPKLESFSDFYLAGGTGLALQLGHRVSVDLDLFTQEEFPNDLLSQVENEFSEAEIEAKIQQAEQLMVEINNVEVTFIGYPFPVLSEFLDYKGVSVLPAKEIAAMKAYSVGRRATYKDYIDLYTVVKEEITTLEEIIETCNKKFEEKFDKRIFLEQLVYLEDIEKKNIQFLNNEVEQKEIQSFFEEKIKNINI